MKKIKLSNDWWEDFVGLILSYLLFLGALLYSSSTFKIELIKLFAAYTIIIFIFLMITKSRRQKNDRN